VSNAPVRCAIYTRKSSEEGLEQSFNSLEAQREACIAYIQSQKHEGWIAIKERYDDGGFSGGNMERPALGRLLDDIRTGKVETVIVYKVDRLTRSLSDFSKIIEIFDSHKVSFVSVTQQFNTTTSMGRLTLNVLLSFAQFERELTGERIRDKVAASKKKGMWMGGMVPLGYDCVDRRLIANQSEAKVVRDIFRQYLRLGSVMKVKDYLEENNIRSKIRTGSGGRKYGGAVYSRGALYQILNNRIYIGRIVHRGQSYVGQHEPIIAQELWNEVAARLEANDQGCRTGKLRPTSSLLTGLLRDTSGIRFTPTHTVKKGKRYRYYTSQAVIRRRGKQRQIARYPARALEALVTAQIHEMLKTSHRYLHETDASPNAELAIQRAKDLGVQWPQLGTPKQEEFIRAVVKIVILGHNNLWIEVDQSKVVATLLGHGSGDLGAPDDRNAAVIKLKVEFQLIRRGAEVRIDVPVGQSIQDGPVPSLVREIARARTWYERLVSGEVSSVEHLARQSGFRRRYVRKILQSAVLSPNIIEAILSGRQARSVTARHLQGQLPLDWKQQEQVFLRRL
jgi:DNA invertase Pin-like site-specific DNA recombinase